MLTAAIARDVASAFAELVEGDTLHFVASFDRQPGEPYAVITTPSNTPIAADGQVRTSSVQLRLGWPDAEAGWRLAERVARHIAAMRGQYAVAADEAYHVYAARLVNGPILLGQDAGVWQITANLLVTYRTIFTF